MTRPEPDTDVLLAEVSRGDASARSRLLDRHRDRLRQMIAVRLDQRLAARVDPSDVVQDVRNTGRHQAGHRAANGRGALAGDWPGCSSRRESEKILAALSNYSSFRR